MLVLVDMDGVIADFHRGFVDEWQKRHPQKPYVPLEMVTDFYLKNVYPKEDHSLVDALYRLPNFYRSLPEIPGAKESVGDIARRHDVFICTTPVLPEHKHCVEEKYAWVEDHYGAEWLGRLILTKDKTVVRGRFLIDDKPEIKGVAKPEWEQVLYDQPYNRNVQGKRRMTWANWRDVLRELA